MVAFAPALIGPQPVLRRGPFSAPDHSPPAPLTIDYPEEGSIFPSDITAPTFLWRDAAENSAERPATVAITGFRDAGLPSRLGRADRLHLRIQGRACKPVFRCRGLRAAQSTEYVWRSAAKRRMGPGQWNTDFALLKNVNVTERVPVQFRAEVFNLLNHNNLDNPNGTMTSVDFARIVSWSGNRTIQLGLRATF